MKKEKENEVNCVQETHYYDDDEDENRLLAMAFSKMRKH